MENIRIKITILLFYFFGCYLFFHSMTYPEMCSSLWYNDVHMYSHYVGLICLIFGTILTLYYICTEYNLSKD